MKNLVVLMLVIVMYFGSNAAGLNLDQDCPKCMLEIVNELRPGRSLQYHCHSKNDNLNVNVLEFKANKKIIFREHYFKKTIWRCVLKQGLWMRYSHDILAYRGSMPSKCGQVYSWRARLDGIYLEKNSRGLPTFKFPWIKI